MPICYDDVAEPDDSGSAGGVRQAVHLVEVINTTQVVTVREKQERRVVNV